MPTLSENKKKTWIAISGMMGSGKSTLISYLKEKGYPIYDCDKINAHLQEKGQKGYLKMIEVFGEDILDDEKKIDKKKVADIIFTDRNKKKELENILHPLILEELEKIHQTSIQTTFVEVPLLYEVNWQSYFDSDWFVYADYNTLKQRCMNYRNMSENEFERRIKNQMSIELKKQKSRVVIENNTTLEAFYKQIDKNLEVLE